MNAVEHVGSRIRLYRKQKGMTLEKLSSQLHIGISTISKYENGKIALDIETLFEIANILDVNVNQLVDYRDQAKIHKTTISTNTFFKRSNIFYLYQFWGRDKKIYESAIEITRDEASPAVDKAILYYEITDPEDFTKCTYLYNGEITYSDSFTHLSFENFINPTDKVFITAKNTFSMHGATPALLQCISQSLRNPYSVKVMISTDRLTTNDELINSLLINDKETITELKRSNALVIY